MRSFTNDYLVDGVPLLAPDQDVKTSFEDIDAASAGRDEAGFMHRIPVRKKVGSWTFSYSTLTQEELRYTEALFENKTTFYLTFPGIEGPEKRLCYRTKYGVAFHNARTGLWRGYSFSVIEC